MKLILLVILLVLAAAMPATQPATATDYATELHHGQSYAGPRTQSHLDQIKLRLANRDARLAAVHELLDFAGLSAYAISDLSVSYGDGTDNVRDQACRLLNAAADDPTVRSALLGSDAMVKLWGLYHFDELKDPRAQFP
ncbi:MAG TPA: hypothetical protein VHY37_14025, partial [Tepidisphaeraceae bacterium]|nr:hypothetical protein [Tepidisphaeraceae bacterium]